MGLHTDPLLVDVGQEEAVLLVEVLVSGVVPVLRLHQAGDHKNNLQAVKAGRCSDGAEGVRKGHLLFLNKVRVGPGVQSLTDEVAHLGALSRTPGQPVHT